MPGAAESRIPSLSQIIGWGTQHLEVAAEDWNTTAQRWEDQFAAVQRATLAPGGTAWEGGAAEAAQERAFADLVKVRALVSTLQDAATEARRGADRLARAKRDALEAVGGAEELGFVVAEDLSVTSRHRSVGWMTQMRLLAFAKQHEAAITGRAAALSVLDNEVAAKIGARSAPLSEFAFTETAPPATSDTEEPHSIQVLGEDSVPAGPVILCEPGPRGGPWEFDCHVFYPGGGADMYPSDVDDSGGYP
ncbi:hypothetical protein [Mycolicibacterium hippocampi]|uniref:hypothetical protein n=1 Tax=Mycolicibacterium hippocampi TaxID=659824 RepID=UPI003514942A